MSEFDLAAAESGSRGTQRVCTSETKPSTCILPFVSTLPTNDERTNRPQARAMYAFRSTLARMFVGNDTPYCSLYSTKMVRRTGRCVAWNTRTVKSLRCWSGCATTLTSP